MSDCVFCRIVDKDLPSYNIYEDKNFLAILDQSQFTKGHTIVIPKKHHINIWEVVNIKEYSTVIQKIGKHFLNLGFEYVDTLTLGRMVPHCHVHLIPHNGGYNDWTDAISKIGDMQHDKDRRLTNEEGEKLANKFRLQDKIHK
ncbi:HIT domain-containing protein [Candidatus Dojkabacteria bacterium]|nr:HIT domain-containing protein [Candidatus Dojkabacteria bacterium]